MTRKKFLKYAFILVCSFVSVSLYSPMSLAAETQEQEQDIPLKSKGYFIIRASAGYRIDDLDWNVAGLNDFDQTMDKLSELVYDDMEIRQRGIAVNLVFDRVYSRASISLGQIRDGQGKDFDYFYDEDNGGRFSPYSISRHEIYNDDVLDITAGIGYRFLFLGKRLTIVPLAGVSSHEQNIRMTDGYQTYTSDQALLIGFPDVGPFSRSLNSTYKTEWTSWWLGTDIHLEVIPDLFLISSLEYHMADYETTADWNLIDSFSHPLSFTQAADGKGFVANVGIEYTFIPKWNAGLMVGWTKWSTDRGVETLFWSDGDTSPGILNEANWTSKSLNLSISYKF